ncbi:MAG TPA: toll/interleukin-1 receptor domain-containing protein [Mycobacteriales bacterium]|nr:toll/interleukin-1 receptor domain-containing protein [Mycobacteriales bacterium]
MALAHRDRFRIKSQLSDALEEDREWTFSRRNLLFGEFGLPQQDGDWNGFSLADVLAQASDETLIELYGIVLGVDTNEVVNVVESAPSDSGWKSGYARVFLSHSAQHKEFAGQVADELAVMGIHAFVAHDAMEYSQPWQEQIEHALRTMEAFVALVHPEARDSAWCNQEIGWALGRRVPRYVVRMGADPAGFVGREQWPSGHARMAKQVAQLVYRWVAGLRELGPSILDGLFSALTDAGNYIDAGAASERVAALESLAPRDWERLHEVWWSNDQLHGGVLATRAMRPFYEQNRQPWPPPKPAPPAPVDPDEPPF